MGFVWHYCLVLRGSEDVLPCLSLCLVLSCLVSLFPRLVWSCLVIVLSYLGLVVLCDRLVVVGSFHCFFVFGFGFAFVFVFCLCRFVIDEDGGFQGRHIRQDIVI